MTLGELCLWVLGISAFVVSSVDVIHSYVKYKEDGNITPTSVLSTSVLLLALALLIAYLASYVNWGYKVF